MTMKCRFLVALLVSISILLLGCSSIPKEAVDLSYQIGQDTEAIHQSYRKLIRAHFQQSRRFAEKQWTDSFMPVIIKSAVEEGKLVDVIAGKIIYDPATETFVKPTPGKEYVQLEQSIQIWSKEIAEIISKSRADVLAPIDIEEQKLLDYVDASFSQLARGNAAISAHLASLRKVQEAQDSVLERAELKDLRDHIDSKLAALSDESQKSTERLNETRQKVDELKLKLKGGK